MTFDSQTPSTHPDIFSAAFDVSIAPDQRLLTLEKLAEIYAFTDVTKGDACLDEMWRLLQSIKSSDVLINYFLGKATIENQQYQYKKAFKYFHQAIELVEKVGDAAQQAEVYIDYAGTCINAVQLEEAEKNLVKASKLLKIAEKPNLEARLICREGYIQLHYSNYSEAIELLLQAEKILDGLVPPYTVKDAYFKVLVQSGLGKIYERNGDKRKCVEAFHSVVQMSESIGMRSRMSWHYLNLGNAHLALDELLQAEEFFRKALEYNDDLSKQARASAAANLGYCKQISEEYESALSLYDEAALHFREIDQEDYYNLSIIESRKGNLFFKQESYEVALQHYLAALRMAKSIDDYRQLSSVCREIAELYAAIEDFRNAYDYQSLHHRFEEQYLEQVNMRQQMELQIKYEAEKKQQQVKLAQLQATQLQLKALRAQMNPHFMYNALNSIQHFITMHDAASAAKYLAKFANLMRKSLEYSELEIISLEKEIEFLRDYLVINEKLRFEDKLSFEIYIDDEIEEDIFGVPTMIVQPYVENAIEHGLRSKKRGLVKVSFYLEDEETILCVVEDNGIGLKKAQELQAKDDSFKNHKSMGTKITEKRLELLHNANHDKLFVKIMDRKDANSEKSIGTRVEIKIPIMEIPDSNA
jgi:two-component system LytT family sensor kinase